MNAEIVAVVEDLIAAENTRNAEAAGRLLAPDFSAITRARGVEQDRAGLLYEIANPTSAVQRQIEGELSVRQSGDLAVVRSIVAVVDESSSPPGLRRFRNTHVLTWHGEAWKCAAWQVTKLE
jgi:ketosteroid isomerase-like protein